MTAKLLTEHNLEFLSLKEGCTGSSEFINVKMPHCWKFHVVAAPHLIGGNRKRYQQSTNADKKSIETVFLIAICHQSKTLFLLIFYLRSSIFGVFDCRLPGVGSFDIVLKI